MRELPVGTAGDAGRGRSARGRSARSTQDARSDRLVRRPPAPAPRRRRFGPRSSASSDTGHRFLGGGAPASRDLRKRPPGQRRPVDLGTRLGELRPRASPSAASGDKRACRLRLAPGRDGRGGVAAGNGRVAAGPERPPKRIGPLRLGRYVTGGRRLPSPCPAGGESCSPFPPSRTRPGGSPRPGPACRSSAR